MTLQQKDEHLERCCCQEKQKQLDPWWCNNLPTLGTFKPYSEIVAGMERIKQQNARIRAKLEAKAAAGGVSSASYPPLSCL